MQGPTDPAAFHPFRVTKTRSDLSMRKEKQQLNFLWSTLTQLMPLAMAMSYLVSNSS
jgi:hypothetical protein